jgi:hypothetical protein
LEKFVMPGPVPGIHVFGATRQDVDGRHKAGHDEGTSWTAACIFILRCGKKLADLVCRAFLE